MVVTGPDTLRALPPVIDMVRVNMSSRQERAMRRIDAENYNTVMYLTARELRKCSRNPTDAFLRAGVVALKQYYATVVFDGRNMHALSDVLDDFWHSHIIDTLQYEILCKDVGGFMYHDPLDKTDDRKVAAVAQIYQYTREVLGRVFGLENLDSTFYPAQIATDALVCLHDVPETLTRRDLPPPDPRVEQFRSLYGTNSRRSIIIKEVERALRDQPDNGKPKKKYAK